MPMEEEVPFLLISGFSIFVTVVALSTSVLWLKNRKLGAGYVWILLHLSLLSVTFYFVHQAITVDPANTMSSENISLQIGRAGAFWALSMICLLVAIFMFTRMSKNRN